MKSEFLISGIETGQLNAMVKNVMRQTGIDNPEEAVRMMNAGELQVSVVSRNWREVNNIIYFTVTSNGRSGRDWIEYLESKGFFVSKKTKTMLLSSDFKPTNQVMEIAILKCSLWENKDKISKKICSFASGQNFSKPTIEVACLIREKFSNADLKEMGLWFIVVMHEPIMTINGLEVINIDRYGDAWLQTTQYPKADVRWREGVSFAFISKHNLKQIS